MRKNPTKKLNLALFFGGRGAEHEVSVVSAQNIFRAIDKEKYKITLVGLKKDGSWVKVDRKDFLKEKYSLTKEKNFVSPLLQKNKFFIGESPSKKEAIDLAFPILHGPLGEDGTIQGLLTFFNVPFVGAGVIGSAVGMDKDVMKRLLCDAGIKVAKFLVYEKNQAPSIKFQEVVRALKLPLFVKPANLGSSVGINKVKTQKDFAVAVKKAFKYDEKIIIEENIVGREIECAVLGNDDPKASILGEIVPRDGFYSYKAKYLDKQGAELLIPSKLPASTTKTVQSMAVKTFKVLCCKGLGRVDFFLKENGEVLVNEINTIPGFTSISMYPKLWEKSGIPYAKLIDKLIGLALEKKY